MAVHATFGTTEYIEPNIIHIPMTFSQNICAIECSDFSITGIDALESLHVSGEGSEFSLHISPAIGLVGVMFVEIIGSVYLLGNDPERVISPIRSVRYDSRDIYVTGKQLPPSILPGLQSAYFDLNREVAGVNPHAILISGVDVGQPKIYSAPTPDNDLISGLRPLDAEYVEYNNSDSPRRYFRLDFEFPEPPPIGNLNIDIKDGSVIGYVDPYVAPEIPEMNLSFSAGVPFTQSYKLKSSEVIETYDAVTNPRGFNITGLPAGIIWRFERGIIFINQSPTSVGTGVAIITVGDISVERPWEVFGFNRRRGDRSTRQSVPVLSFNTANATIYLDEAFSISGFFSGPDPTEVYVEGLLRNWFFTWTPGSTLTIRGGEIDVTRVESGVWKIIFFYAGGPSNGVSQELNWSVIERPPVIINPGTKTIYGNHPMRIPVEISNKPTGVIMDGVLNFIKYKVTEEGSELSGFPQTEVPASANRMVEVRASTSGGDDTDDFQLIVLDQTAPSMPTVTYTGGKSFSWTPRAGVDSYAYRIESIYDENTFTEIPVSVRPDNPHIDVGNVSEFTIEELNVNFTYIISWIINSPYQNRSLIGDYRLEFTTTAYVGSVDISAQNIDFSNDFGGITVDTVNNEVLIAGNLTATSGWHRFRLDGTYLGAVTTESFENGFSFVAGLGFENINNRVLLTSGLTGQSFRGWLSYELDGSYVGRYGGLRSGVAGITHDTGGGRIVLGSTSNYTFFNDQTYAQVGSIGAYNSANADGVGVAYIVGSEGNAIIVADSRDRLLYVYDSLFTELLRTISFPFEISNPNIIDIAADEEANEILALDVQNEQWHRFII